MEASSTPPCPNTITVRRNPHRRARPTPATSALKPLPCPLSPPQIPQFPLSDILAIQLPQNPNPDPPESLRVFLRIRPNIENKAIKAEKKNVWPQRIRTKNETTSKLKKTKSEICVSINDYHSVSLFPPRGLVEVKRAKLEVFEGFSHVFSPDSSQVEVFDKMVKPLVDEFLRGKSGMLAALGPSGSGKTHTVFGSPREPGMVPQALGQIFSKNGVHETQSSRTFYLSMFEICSERGKAERLCDLLQDGGDLCLQQSSIKGLQEVLISNVQQAECFIARGMLKRATAMTNSNSQSSRSQCVINIRTVESKIDKEVDVQFNCAVLTIVDLAGAEREKKTGNQGARLQESNFINNTSMVFGQCLRSLLEHQKNPKKPLQKHFQGSLLTRYLREYLEGKKRMALILTVKSGEEDYLDSSLLLRQASPYMKIKFNNVDESANLLCTKRQKQTLPRTEKQKRLKVTPEECVNNNDKGVGDQLQEEDGQKRNHVIMKNFAKAIWNVLKEYKANLEMAENQIKNLKESLADEKARRSELEVELKDLKGYLSCPKKDSTVNEDSSFANGFAQRIGSHQIDDVLDSISLNVSSSSSDDSESPGQNYQVPENKIRNNRESLAAENGTCFELEMELKVVKGPCSCQVETSPVNGESSFGSRSAGQDGCQEIDDLHDLVSRSPSQGQSYPNQIESVMHVTKCNQVIANQIQGIRENLADDVRCSELDIEMRDEDCPLSCSKVTSWVKKDISFGNKSKEQDGCQEIDDVRVLESCNDSSSVVDNSGSQGQSYQYEFTDKESGSFLGEDDSSEALNDLTDAGKYDSQFKAASGHPQPLASSPEALTKENIHYSAEKNRRHDEEYKATKNQFQNARESHADEIAKCSELELDMKDVLGGPSRKKGTSSVNKDSFLGSKSAKQEGFQEFDDVHASNSAVDNFESQGQSYWYQLSDNKCGDFLGEVDSSEALKDLTDTGHSQPLISSTETLTITKEKVCPSAEENKSQEEEYKEHLRQSMKTKEAKFHLDCDVNNTLKNENRSKFTCKPASAEKPKRRLAPASSVLLRDLGSWNFEDEKPKGTKGDKKLVPLERKITQGSLSLLRLLNNNLYS